MILDFSNSCLQFRNCWSAKKVQRFVEGSMAIWVSRDSEYEPHERESESVRSAIRLVGVAHTAKAFWERCAGVCAKVAILKGAAAQVQASTRLRKVVDHFLDMAEVLGVPCDDGLSPRALVALAETEAQPGSTVLEIFVETAFTCGEESSLSFIREMPDLAAAPSGTRFITYGHVSVRPHPTDPTLGTSLDS